LLTFQQLQRLFVLPLLYHLLDVKLLFLVIEADLVAPLTSNFQAVSYYQPLFFLFQVIQEPFLSQV